MGYVHGLDEGDRLDDRVDEGGDQSLLRGRLNVFDVSARRREKDVDEDDKASSQSSSRKQEIKKAKEVAKKDGASAAKTSNAGLVVGVVTLAGAIGYAWWVHRKSKRRTALAA